MASPIIIIAGSLASEEKLFVYKFSFNGGEQPNVNLCVTYREEGEDWDGGEGFMGMIEDALVNETC